MPRLQVRRDNCALTRELVDTSLRLFVRRYGVHLGVRTLGTCQYIRVCVFLTPHIPRPYCRCGATTVLWLVSLSTHRCVSSWRYGIQFVCTPVGPVSIFVDVCSSRHTYHVRGCGAITAPWRVSWWTRLCGSSWRYGGLTPAYGSNSVFGVPHAIYTTSLGAARQLCFDSWAGGHFAASHPGAPQARARGRVRQGADLGAAAQQGRPLQARHHQGPHAVRGPVRGWQQAGKIMLLLLRSIVVAVL